MSVAASIVAVELVVNYLGKLWGSYKKARAIVEEVKNEPFVKRLTGAVDELEANEEGAEGTKAAIHEECQYASRCLDSGVDYVPRRRVRKRIGPASQNLDKWVWE